MRSTLLALLLAGSLGVAAVGCGRPATTLEGRVTATDGQPVAGARVWALLTPEIRKSHAEFSAPSGTTAADGSFSIPAREPGQEHEVWVCADGFLQEAVTVHFPEEPVQVRLRPAASIRGRVLGPDGSPVAGAEVDAFQMDRFKACSTRIASPCPPEQPTTSDAEGRFHLASFRPAWYVVTAQVPELVDAAAAVSPVRAAAGEPVEVELRLPEGSTRIEQADLVPGLGEKRASLESVERPATPVEVAPEAPQAEAEASEPTRKVSGRVQDSDGSPIAGIEVSFRKEGWDTIARTWTRANGNFSSTVPEGESTAVVHWYGLDHELPVEDRGRVSGLEIRLERGVTVGGRLRGMPLWERTEVRFDGPSSRTLYGEIDLDGNWSAEWVPPGRWAVTALRLKTMQALQRTIEVPADATKASYTALKSGIDFDFTNAPVVTDEELRKLWEQP